MKSVLDLWKVGASIAVTPDLSKRLNHSKFARDIGIGQGKWRTGGFVGILAEKAVKYGLAFIPIPVVKSVVSAVFDAAVEKAKDLHRSKQTESADLSNDLGRKVKWGWKTKMDLEATDRYRAKVAHAYQELWAAMNKLVSNSQSATTCNDLVHTMYKYCYFIKRVNRLRADLEGYKAVIQETDDWLKEVEGAVERSNIRKTINGFAVDLVAEAQKINAIPPGQRGDDFYLALVNHFDCSESNCVLSDKRRFWDDPNNVHKKRIYKGMTKAGNFLEAVGAPVAGGFLDKDAHDGKYYQQEK